MSEEAEVVAPFVISRPVKLVSASKAYALQGQDGGSVTLIVSAMDDEDADGVAEQIVGSPIQNASVVLFSAETFEAFADAVAAFRSEMNGHHGAPVAPQRRRRRQVRRRRRALGDNRAEPEDE